MRIAATYENGEIFQHFGRSEQFKLYDVKDGKILGSMVVNTMGAGHGALAAFLQVNMVNVVLCGGIGPGAQNALASAGIQIYAGCSGNTDACVNALLQGTLVQQAGTCGCGHHEEGHTCGGHGEGGEHHCCH